MSRVTAEQHLRRRSLLQVLCLETPGIYGLLSVPHQWELHEFYLPSREVDINEFEANLLKLKRTKPSLANPAGKHFRALERVYLELRAAGFSFDDPVASNRALLPHIWGRIASSGLSGRADVAPEESPYRRRVVGRREPNDRQLARALLAVATKLNQETSGDTSARSANASSHRDAARSHVRLSGRVRIRRDTQISLARRTRVTG